MNEGYTCKTCEGTGKVWVFTGQTIMQDMSGEHGINWRGAINAAAFKAMQAANSKPIEVAMTAFFDFVMPRPKAHYKKDQLRDDAPEYHTNTPDVTKLVRQIEDSIIGVAIADDKLIVSYQCSKKYGATPGAHVRLVPL